MVLLDWEAVDIGDPAYDVGNAYHMVKFFSNPQDPDSAEPVAERFLSTYLRESKIDLGSRLKFYQVVGILGYAISYSATLSSPTAFLKRRGKILQSIPYFQLPIMLLAFPFLRWSFIAHQMQVEGNIYWLRYFRKFLKGIL